MPPFSQLYNKNIELETPAYRQAGLFLPRNVSPKPPDVTRGSLSGQFRFLMRRVLPAPFAVFFELDLPLNFLLILPTISGNPLTDGAFKPYQIFRSFRFCHMPILHEYDEFVKSGIPPLTGQQLFLPSFDF